MPRRWNQRSVRLALSGTLLLLVCAIAAFGDFGDDDSEPPPIAAGTLAPAFTTTTLTGKPFSLSSLKGHVTVLDFWATWCGPCVADIPGFEKLFREYHTKGVDVVGMSLDTDTVAKVKPVTSRLGVTYIVTANPKQNLTAGREYNANSLPCVYIVDRRGIVRWSVSGYYDAKATHVRAELDRVLQEK